LSDAVQTESPVSAARSERPKHSVVGLSCWRGWLPLAVLPWTVVFLAPPTLPRWALMWALAFAIFCGCKWLTWRRTPVQGVPLWRHAGYLTAWPGLDAASFLNSSPPPMKPAPPEWLFAWCKLALGASLLFVAARWVPVEHPYWLGWVGMAGHRYGPTFRGLPPALLRVASRWGRCAASDELAASLR